MTADAQAAFASYQAESLEAIAAASSEDALEAVRVEFLGKKHGRLKDLQSLLGQAAPAQRPVLGKVFNEVRTQVESALEARRAELSVPEVAVAAVDAAIVDGLFGGAGSELVIDGGYRRSHGLQRRDGSRA